MSENDDSDGEPTRLNKISRVFGGTTDDVELSSGIEIGPSPLRRGAYEIRHPDGGAFDVVDIDQFRSVRELHEYIHQFEVTDQPPEDLGHGVA